LICLLAFAAFSAFGQDWRGRGRLEGMLTDQNGKPVAGATIAAKMHGATSGLDAKSGKDGRWSILGMATGTWDIDITAPGFIIKKVSVSVNENNRMPRLDLKLDPAPVEQPKPVEEPPKEELKIGGKTVSEETVKAVENGNALLKEQKFNEAIAEYEKAYAVLPDNVALERALARAYYGAGNKAKTIELLKKVVAAEQTDTATQVLLANVLLETGNLEEGKAVLEKLPAGALPDATAVINVGILFMNKKQPAEAAKWFTKAIDMEPKTGDGYYYRGLSEVQMKKNKEAKEDLKKFLELAPNAPEAKEAKELIAALK
jgi:Tfp pilus assembly protein PilF